MNFKLHLERNIVETGPTQPIENSWDPMLKELLRTGLAFGVFAVSGFSHRC